MCPPAASDQRRNDPTNQEAISKSHDTPIHRFDYCSKSNTDEASADWSSGAPDLDGQHGAGIWCGHGVFAHNLVKISGLTA